MSSPKRTTNARRLKRAARQRLRYGPLLRALKDEHSDWRRAVRYEDLKLVDRADPHDPNVPVVRDLIKRRSDAYRKCRLERLLEEEKRIGLTI